MFRSNLIRGLATFGLMVLVGLGLPASTAAQFLVINDCNGFTRAIERVGDQGRNIQFDVSGAQGNVSGARISLTNDLSGEVRYAAAKGGKVTFGNVLPGTYTVATEATNLVIGAIAFSPLTVLGVTGSTIVGGLVVAGGATGVALGTDAVVKATDGDPGAPVPTPTPTPEPTPDECDVCDPDASPPPLDEGDFTSDPTVSAALSPSR